MAFSRGGWSVGGGGLGWSLSVFVSVISVLSMWGSSSGGSFAVSGTASGVVLVFYRLLVSFLAVFVSFLVHTAIMVFLGF